MQLTLSLQINVERTLQTNKTDDCNQFMSLTQRNAMRQLEHTVCIPNGQSQTCQLNLNKFLKLKAHKNLQRPRNERKLEKKKFIFTYCNI